jgi:hypothetical protein
MSTVKGGNSIITDGLLLYLDTANATSYSGTGANFKNLGSTKLTPTIVGNPTINTTNGSMTLDGTGTQYIEVVADGTIAGFNIQNFTIDCWVNLLNDGSYEALWSYDYTSHITPFYAQHIRTNNPQASIQLSCNNGVNVNKIGIVNYGTWQNFTFIRSLDNGTTSLYLDGQLEVNNTGQTNSIDYYNQEVWIGKANITTGNYTGDIGPYKFYNRALTASEVLQNYKATKSRFGL